MNLYKKVSLLLLFLLGLISCNSMNHFNKKYETKIHPSKLKSDVDYIHNKFTKLHPNLYTYISKKDLDFKFDSIKETITEPLTRKEFYFKISPIVASIKQGHASVELPFKKLPEKQRKIIKSTKLVTPISNFDVEFFDEKLFITKNKSVDSTIQVGTEIIWIDSVKPFSVVEKYYHTFASDGYNTTYKKSIFNENILDYYFVEKGYKDSVQVLLAYKGDTISKLIKREIQKESKTKNKNINKLSKSCELSFVGKDSSIAMLRISEFKEIFYEKYFKKIDSVCATKLILDLRGNPGGMLISGKRLFSYLIDTTYYFFHPNELISRTSILHTNRFSQKKLIGKLFHIAFLPIKIIKFGVQILSIKKIDNRFFYTSFLNDSKVQPDKKYSFKYKIYVITDGGSFSTTCILSSNLKGYKLATFVGEETGGDYNGTCAGYIPQFTLPHSKLKVHFGLMYVRPTCFTDIKGRGIMPDVEIIPTMDDRINQRDPELQWILNDIQNHP